MRVWRSRGFTLLEVLFSLVVITMILPLTFAALSLGLGGKQRVRTESRATEIAQRLFLQIPMAWSESTSEMFPASDPLVFPELGSLESGGVLLTAKGELYREEETESQGWLVETPDEVQTLTNGYVVRVFRSALAAETESALQKITLEVQYPSGMIAERRQQYRYARVFRNK